MPYYITYPLKDMPVEWHYEPEIEMADYRPFLKGGPISEKEISKFPKKLVITDVSKVEDIPEIIHNGAQPGIVSEPIKIFLDNNDKWKHRFFPIKVYLKNKDTGLVYYFIYTDNKISSICYEKTGFGVDQELGYEAAFKVQFRPDVSLNGEMICSLYKDKVEGSHLWRNPDNENMFRFFCSDEFGNYLKEIGAWGWYLCPCKWEY